jgi:hypothetical protein
VSEQLLEQRLQPAPVGAGERAGERGQGAGHLGLDGGGEGGAGRADEHVDGAAVLGVAGPLQIVGSGQGSVSTRDILAELPALAEQITRGTFDIDAKAVPLADGEAAWADSTHRTVLVPSR